jgi:hypothetical protein
MKLILAILLLCFSVIAFSQNHEDEIFNSYLIWSKSDDIPVMESFYDDEFIEFFKENAKRKCGISCRIGINEKWKEIYVANLRYQFSERAKYEFISHHEITKIATGYNLRVSRFSCNLAGRFIDNYNLVLTPKGMKLNYWNVQGFSLYEESFKSKVIEAEAELQNNQCNSNKKTT